MISLARWLLFLLSTTFLSGQNLSQEQHNTLDKITIQDVPKGAPGVAVGIVKNGQIIYENYAGYANIEDSLTIDKNTRFNIASNGKQFTALAILVLEEQQKLRLDDDIRKYLPKLFKNIEEPIQIKHLLNHSSGIRDVYDLWSLQGFTWWKQTYSNSDALLLLEKQEALNFMPGTNYSYSNSNYILLAEIIEKITQTSFVNYTDQLFQKLGMPNTSFVDDYTNIEEPIARPYFNFSTWKTYDWTCNLHGDGNLFSTLTDQLRWEKLLQTQESTHFSKELLAKTQQLIKNTTIEKYGYGLEFGTYKELPYKYHEGATGAWKAVTVRFPTENTTIVTMINTGKIIPMMQTMQMADVLLETKETEKESFPIVPAKIGAKVSTNDILGVYRTSDGYVMEFEERDGELYMIRWGRNDIKLEREAANIFYQWNDNAFKQEFTKNSNGNMQVTVYYPTVPPFTLTRIESDLSAFDKKALNGTFYNPETGVSFQVSHASDNTYELMVRDQKRNGTLVNDHEILAGNYNLSFTKDKKGVISEIYLTSNRIQNVRFIRK